MIDKAFVLAAGLGTRMRPLTDTTPKPLLRIAGRSMLDRALDQLEEAGVTDVVVNTHHLAEQITEDLKRRESPWITLSHEPVLLDTAGGIKKMLQFFAGKPFYVLAGDNLIVDETGESALRLLQKAWNPDTMDILILLQRVESMKLTRGAGDYNILPDSRAVRSRDKSGTHMFTSVRINHPRIFDGTPDGPFSYLQLLDQAEAAGRLYCIDNPYTWHHLTTPEDVANVNQSTVV